MFHLPLPKLDGLVPDPNSRDLGLEAPLVDSMANQCARPLATESKRNGCAPSAKCQMCQTSVWCDNKVSISFLCLSQSHFFWHPTTRLCTLHQKSHRLPSVSLVKWPDVGHVKSQVFYSATGHSLHNLEPRSSWICDSWFASEFYYNARCAQNMVYVLNCIDLCMCACTHVCG